ncbi:MAG TPA: ATP phosphoribosyltransferase regulatory subunit [Vicinamibacterales bacterium]|nr:ATP phosphoribosyltransferase regulatory subunit [Vicinamibacterales bacterium]
MSKVLPAKGFRDFAPAAKRRKEQMLSAIRACYLRYGFDEIETPAAEPIERLRGSEGGENLAMIFEILRRGLGEAELRTAKSPGELSDLGLRYDLTVPLARYYASNQAELPAVFRAIQIGPVWRAEKPQKGRYRQFTQCDIDIIGDASTLAEIELIVATLEAVREIGLSGATVRLNDRRFLDALIAGAGLGADQKGKALIIIDKLDKIGLDGVAAALSEAFTDGSGDRLAASLRALGGDAAGLTIERFQSLVPGCDPAAVADHRAIVQAVREIGGPAAVRFDPTLVRGLGYYTGPIFEVEHPASQSSVGGGGRYDNMIGTFLGQRVPACGFSLGVERLLEIAAEDAAAAPGADRVALIYDDNDAQTAIMARQQQLLRQGLTVRLVRSARNKQRMFDDLLRAGYGRAQRVSDEATAFRDLGAPPARP